MNSVAEEPMAGCPTDKKKYCLMAVETLLQKIAASDSLSELMAWPLDFEVTNQVESGWFRLSPGVVWQTITQDGTGGIFALLGPGDGEDRPVLFISSEGKAGQIAGTLAEAMQLMIAYPYWRDCLKFSGGGSLEQMKRAVPYLERDLHEDEPAIDELREELFTGLDLTYPVDALENLHRELSDSVSHVHVFSADGSGLEDLFGDFTVEDNPLWSQTQ